MSLKPMAGNTMSIIPAQCFLQHSAAGVAYHFTDARSLATNIM
jgi:hypothetical protein